MSVALLEPAVVEPSLLWVPQEATGTAGQEAIDLMTAVGVTLDPEQQLAVRALLSTKAGGRWAAPEGAIVEARQNGKSDGVLLPIALAKLFLFGSKLIWWTAHLYRTAHESFIVAKDLVTGSDELSRFLARAPIESHGEEGFELVGGARLMFIARSKIGGRGPSPDDVVLDEAFALTAAQMGSLMPSMSSRPNPQALYGTSGLRSDSEHMHSARKRVTDGGDSGLAWVEWSAPRKPCLLVDCQHWRGSRGCALDDEQLWAVANPRLIGRVGNIDWVRNERRTLTPVEFARERLTWHEPPADAGQTIDADKWKACEVAGSLADGPVTIGVDFATHATSAAIVVCAAGVVEVVEHRQGSGWVPGRLDELLAKWDVLGVGLDPTMIPGAIEADLLGLGLVLFDGRRMTHAVTSAMAGIADGTFGHRGEPELDAAVSGARLRNVGDSSRWSRRDSTVDITPLVAATVAAQLWAENDYDVLDSVPDFTKRSPHA